MLNDQVKGRRIEEIHQSENKFADFLRQQDQSYFDPVRQLLKNDLELGDVKVENLGGTDDDFAGTDFNLNDGNCVVRCQNKDRFRNAQSSNKQSGEDIPCEIIRYYRTGSLLKLDLGRDIGQIPTGPVVFEKDTPFIKRVPNTLHHSDLLVLHPSGSSWVHWYLTRVVHFYARKLINTIYGQMARGNTELNKTLRMSYAGTKPVHTLEFLKELSLPANIQLFAKGDRDEKLYSFDGEEPDYMSKANVGKINMYIPASAIKHAKTKDRSK